MYTSTPLRFINLCVRQPSMQSECFIRPVTSGAHLGQICPLKHNWLCVRLTGQNQNRLEFRAGWRKVCKHKHTPKKKKNKIKWIHVSKHIQPDSPLQHYKTMQSSINNIVKSDRKRVMGGPEVMEAERTSNLTKSRLAILLETKTGSEF